MFYAIWLSVLTAVCVFFAVEGLGDLAVDRIYMSPETVAARKARIYSRFSAYVTENAISGQDTQAVAAWSAGHRYVTILIFKGDSLDLRVSGGKVQSSDSMENYERLQYSQQYGKLYPMRFSDGVYQIAIGDSSETREYFLNRLIALALGVMAFMGILLLYVRRLSLRIIHLSHEAVEIGAGDLERPITVSGEDELAMLAAEMDQMRRSLIQRMSSERQAWEANSELITAISHDIRTPMTSLIGYLGLLNENGFDDPERCRQFAASAYGKAMELKDLTDELFRYFLVFGRADPRMDVQTYDASLLLEQLLGEAEYDLTDAGFSVRHIEFSGGCAVNADPLYLKRVFDNLVSNIKKYADPRHPVVVLPEWKGGFLSVALSNRVKKLANPVESTKIGLRTCEKIMSLLGGSFAAGREGETFTARLKLPAIPAPPEETPQGEE